MRKSEPWITFFVVVFVFHRAGLLSKSLFLPHPPQRPSSTATLRAVSCRPTWRRRWCTRCCASTATKPRSPTCAPSQTSARVCPAPAACSPAKRMVQHHTHTHSWVQPVHLSSCYFCHRNSSTNICCRFIHWKKKSVPLLFFLFFSSLFLHFFSLGLWPAPSGTFPARNPLEHPVPCLNPQDSEEPCEVTRSSSMGHLCEWGLLAS